jgi:hypothetical protein
MTTPQERTSYLLRALVVAKREQKMARKTRDVGLIHAADGRLARVWRDAEEHVDALGASGVKGLGDAS